MISRNDRVLFQGDSITDAMRDRSVAGPNDPGGMGSGYAFIAASRLLAERPNDGLQFYNRGISGEKVFQLAERWECDCLALKPDVLSILVGVNDIGHKIEGTYDGTLEVYERDYGRLLERTRRALPNVKLVICEPFLLRCGAIDNRWFPEFDAYRAAARQQAEAFDAKFVPFQAAFDEATRQTPPEYWAPDGVHPTMAGHHLMAQTWLEAVNS